ncbi:hypothetical protein ONZ51_g10335 [Trametes cubensis]|uniref:Elongator complex protein 4 n=1 Tax=Trametes cubensis TaxID=1111947 RepID=A0AAD7TKU6_9APHY|nr:hypothetical protein ONZ51_g10335 [Trametes cubensis]
MSAFKRRTTAKQQPLPTGTRTSPGSIATIITSTGIPSLDDILGGGLPLSCSLLVLAPDAHSAYGELVLKYFAAQGLACGQRSAAADDEEDERASEHDTKIKIAWRYEQMKQFQTTVSTPSQSADDFCRTFDLTARMPEAVINSARSEGRFLDIDPQAESSATSSPCRNVIQKLSEILAQREPDHSLAPRVCIPSLGSYEWGDLSPQEAFGGPGWVQKLGWLTDASVTIAAFGSNPSLTAMFSSHHGLVHIHALPAPHTLLPPSDKFSTLRGLTSSGENNLAFKCMRKRLIFETLHLDVEGGVSERRTTPSANTIAMEAGAGHDHSHSSGTSTTAPAGTTSLAAVQVQLEQVQVSAPSQPAPTEPTVTKPGSSFKKAKVKKKVAFHSERPDLYDF